MTFLFDVNNVAMTGPAAMFKMKTLMVSAGWVVKSSGDGLAAFSSTGDVITTGAAGAGGWANTSAWVRIQMPSANGVTRELILQRNATNLIWTIRYSYSAGFTGGSPSATVLPTATDSASIFANTTLFAADNSYRFNAAVDNAAPYGFWMGAFPIGGGNPSGGAFVMTPLTFTAAEDIDPYVFYVSGGGSAYLATDMFALKSWIIKGDINETFQSIGAVRYFQNDGTGVFSIPSGIGTNPHTANDDVFPIPMGWNTQNLWPSGWKGFSTILKWNGPAKTTGDTLSISTTRDRIIYRECNLPWDGSVPTV